MKLATAIDEFLLANEVDGLRVKTNAWYRAILGRFLQRIKDMVLIEITTNQIRQYLADLRRAEYSEDTIAGYTRALHRFWKWCSREYKMDNPMTNIRYPKPPKTKKPKAITIEDMIKMFDAVGGDELIQVRDKAILAMLADTGARAGGVVNIHCDDIDWVRNRIMVNEKGDKLRVVVFTEFTADLLRRWDAGRSAAIGPFFYNLNTGRALTPSGLYQICKRIAKDAGVRGKFGPHAFRHGFAREYILAGGDVSMLGPLMGHEDEKSTRKYLIFADRELAAKHGQFSQVRFLQKKDRSEDRLSS